MALEIQIGAKLKTPSIAEIRADVHQYVKQYENEAGKEPLLLNLQIGSGLDNASKKDIEKLAAEMNKILAKVTEAFTKEFGDKLGNQLKDLKVQIQDMSGAFITLQETFSSPNLAKALQQLQVSGNMDFGKNITQGAKEATKAVESTGRAAAEVVKDLKAQGKNINTQITKTRTDLDKLLDRKRKLQEISSYAKDPNLAKSYNSTDASNNTKDLESDLLEKNSRSAYEYYNRVHKEISKVNTELVTLSGSLTQIKTKKVLTPEDAKNVLSYSQRIEKLTHDLDILNKKRTGSLLDAATTNASFFSKNGKNIFDANIVESLYDNIEEIWDNEKVKLDKHINDLSLKLPQVEVDQQNIKYAGKELREKIKHTSGESVSMKVVPVLDYTAFKNHLELTIKNVEEDLTKVNFTLKPNPLQIKNVVSEVQTQLNSEKLFIEVEPSFEKMKASIDSIVSYAQGIIDEAAVKLNIGVNPVISTTTADVAKKILPNIEEQKQAAEGINEAKKDTITKDKNILALEQKIAREQAFIQEKEVEKKELPSKNRTDEQNKEWRKLTSTITQTNKDIKVYQEDIKRIKSAAIQSSSGIKSNEEIVREREINKFEQTSKALKDVISLREKQNLTEKQHLKLIELEEKLQKSIKRSGANPELTTDYLNELKNKTDEKLSKLKLKNERIKNSNQLFGNKELKNLDEYNKKVNELKNHRLELDRLRKIPHDVEIDGQKFPMRTHQENARIKQLNNINNALLTPIKNYSKLNHLADEFDENAVNNKGKNNQTNLNKNDGINQSNYQGDWSDQSYDDKVKELHKNSAATKKEINSLKSKLSTFETKALKVATKQVEEEYQSLLQQREALKKSISKFDSEKDKYKKKSYEYDLGVVNEGINQYSEEYMETRSKLIADGEIEAQKNLIQLKEAHIQLNDKFIIDLQKEKKLHNDNLKLRQQQIEVDRRRNNPTADELDIDEKSSKKLYNKQIRDLNAGLNKGEQNYKEKLTNTTNTISELIKTKELQSQELQQLKNAKNSPTSSITGISDNYKAAQQSAKSYIELEQKLLNLKDQQCKTAIKLKQQMKEAALSTAQYYKAYEQSSTVSDKLRLAQENASNENIVIDPNAKVKKYKKNDISEAEEKHLTILEKGNRYLREQKKIEAYSDLDHKKAIDSKEQELAKTDSLIKAHEHNLELISKEQTILNENSQLAKVNAQKQLKVTLDEIAAKRLLLQGGKSDGLDIDTDTVHDTNAVDKLDDEAKARNVNISAIKNEVEAEKLLEQQAEKTSEVMREQTKTNIDENQFSNLDTSLNKLIGILGIIENSVKQVVHIMNNGATTAVQGIDYVNQSLFDTAMKSEAATKGIKLLGNSLSAIDLTELNLDHGAEDQIEELREHIRLALEENAQLQGAMDLTISNARFQGKPAEGNKKAIDGKDLIEISGKFRTATGELVKFSGEYDRYKEEQFSISYLSKELSKDLEIETQHRKKATKALEGYNTSFNNIHTKQDWLDIDGILNNTDKLQALTDKQIGKLKELKLAYGELEVKINSFNKSTYAMTDIEMSDMTTLIGKISSLQQTVNNDVLKKDTVESERFYNSYHNSVRKISDQYNSKMQNLSPKSLSPEGLHILDEYQKEYQVLMNQEAAYNKQQSYYSQEQIDNMNTKIELVRKFGNNLSKNISQNFVPGKGNIIDNIGSGITDLKEREIALTTLAKAQAYSNFETIQLSNNNKVLSYSYDDINGKTVKAAITYEELTGQVYNLNKAEKDHIGLFSKMSNTFKQKITEIIRYLGAYQLLYTAFNQLKNGITIIKNIDSAMTELRKTSEATEQQYKSFMLTSAQVAKEIGSTSTAIINSAADWSRLGYSIEEAGALAKNTAIYMNVSGIDDSSIATEHMISTLKAFNVTAEDSIKIVDSFNEVGNNFAISSEGIGTALERSASALIAAGNTIDESISLVGAANIIAQDPESVGNAVKVLSLRIRGAKTELEEMSEETDGLADSTSKLREEIKALTGKDIMLNDDTFKSTYQILKEIASVWGKLTDVSQATVLEKLAGKTRASVISGLIQNMDTAAEILETSVNSAGSGMRENETVLDSISGKITLLKAQNEELWGNFLDSKVIKDFIGLSTKILGLVDNVGLLNTAFIALGAALSFKNKGFKGFFDIKFNGSIENMVHPIERFKDAIGLLNHGKLQSELTNDLDLFQRFADQADDTTDKNILWNNTLANGSKSIKQHEVAIKSGALSLESYRVQQTQVVNATTAMSVASKLATVGLKVLSFALNTAFSIGVGLLIQGIVTYIYKLTQRTAEAAEKAKDAKIAIAELNDELKENKKTLDGLSERYAYLAQGVNQLTNANKSLNADEYTEFLSIVDQLTELFPNLIKGFDSQGHAILNLDGDVNTINNSFKELIELQERLANGEIVKNIPAIFKQSKEDAKAYKDEITSLQEELDYISNTDIISELSKVLSSQTGHSVIDVFDENKNKAIYDFLDMLNIDYSFGEQMENGLIDMFYTPIEDFDTLTDDTITSIDNYINRIGDEYKAKQLELRSNLADTNSQLEKTWSEFNQSIQALLNTNFQYNSDKFSDDMRSGISLLTSSIDLSDLKDTEIKGVIDDLVSSVYSSTPEIQKAFKELVTMPKSDMTEKAVQMANDLLDDLQDTLDLDEGTVVTFKAKLGITDAEHLLPQNLGVALQGKLEDIIQKAYNNSFTNGKAATQEIMAYAKELGDTPLASVAYKIITDPDSNFKSLEEFRQAVIDEAAKIKKVTPITLEVLLKKDGDFNTIFDAYKSKVTTLKEALDKLDKGDLTEGELGELLFTVPELAKYTNDLESGIKKVMAAAKDDALKILNEAIETNTDVIEKAKLEYFRKVILGVEQASTKAGAALIGLKKANENSNKSLEDKSFILSAVKNNLILTNEKVAELSDRYPGFTDNVYKAADGWHVEEGAIDSVNDSIDDLQTAYINAQIAMSDIAMSNANKRLLALGIDLANIATAEEAYKQFAQLYSNPNLNSILPGSGVPKADMEAIIDFYFKLKGEIDKANDVLTDPLSQTGSFKGEMDWVTQSLKVLGDAVSDAQEAFENTDGYDAQIIALDTLLQKQEALKKGYDKAASYYKGKYTTLMKDSAVAKYADEITSGKIFKIKEFNDEKLYNKIVKAQDYWNSWQANQDSSEATVFEMENTEDQKFGINQGKLDSQLSVIQNQKQKILNDIAEIKAAGGEASEEQLIWLKMLSDAEIDFYAQKKKLAQDEIDRITGGNELVSNYENSVENRNNLGSKFVGNVDINNRPIVLNDDGSYSTSRTSASTLWQGDEKTGRDVIVHYTPILPDGTVLTDEALNDYLVNTLSDSKDIMDADKVENGGLGIVYKVSADLDIDKANAWDEKMHTIQDKIYGDEALYLQEITKLAEEKGQSVEEFLTSVATGGNSEELDELTGIIQECDNAISESKVNQSGWNDEMLNIPINELEKLNDELEKSVEILKEQKDDYDKVIGAVTGMLDDEIKALEEQKELINDEDLIDSYTNRIKVAQDELELLQDSNDERQKQIDLEKAQYDLERAKNQRTKRIYREGQGFVYEADTDAIREAQQNLDSLTYDSMIDDKEDALETLEKEKELALKHLDDEIEKLNDIKDIWTEISNTFEKMQGMDLSDLFFGDSNWDERIQSGDTSDFDKMSGAYGTIEQDVSHGEAQIKKNNSVIDELKLYAKTWTETEKDVAIAYDKIQLKVKETLTETAATQTRIDKTVEYSIGWNTAKDGVGTALGLLETSLRTSASTEGGILDGRLSKVRSFVDEYNRLMGILNISGSLESSGTPKVSGGKKIISKHSGMETGLVGESSNSKKFNMISLDKLAPNEIPAVLLKGEAVLNGLQQGNTLANVSTAFFSGANSILNAVKAKQNMQPVFSIGEIHLHEVQNVDGFASAIIKDFLPTLNQQLYK